MPLKTIGKFQVIESDDRFKDTYWPKLSDYVKNKYGDTEITAASQVQDILKDCFCYLCNEFRAVLNRNNKASFFVFVHYIHEDSIEIWRQRLSGINIPVKEEDFAGTRRLMKCILEQGCTIEMIGHPNFYLEMCQNAQAYVAHLEELLYLGQRAFELTEYIARSFLCPHSMGVHVINGELIIYTYPPFNSLFEFIFHDNKRHNKSVAASDCVYEFKERLKNKMNIGFDDISGFLANQLKDPRYRLGVFKLPDLFQELHSALGYPKNKLEELYAGFIVNRINVMSLENSLLKTQDANRYMYRPILQYKIDEVDYWICGANKWAESITQLTTNCFPFGQFPSEWANLPALNNFIAQVKQTHDKVLENPAIEILKGAGLMYDRNVKNLLKANNRNISFITANLGEIDLLFVDEKNTTLFLAECKHNRSRYEFHNWRRDIDKFRKEYETKLQNKFVWIDLHKTKVVEHFEILYKKTIKNKAQFKVVPLFIINAPSLYMYDSEYLVVTLHDLELLLRGEHITVEFNGELNGKKINVRKPYFKNAEKLFINQSEA